MKLLPIAFALTLFAFDVNAVNWDKVFKEVGEFIDDPRSYLSPSNNDEFFRSRDNSSNNDVIDYGLFDFIIIGSGAAGGVIANRLTEGSFTVLLIEAGGKGPEWLTILGLAPLSYSSKWNWGYNTVSQKNSCLGRQMQQCPYTQGKLLGGTSTMNGGIYVRGNIRDYDKWEALGNLGWSYKDCLPYFKKSERADFKIDIEKQYHGLDGVQAIGVAPDDTDDTISNLLAASKDLNKTAIDYNGASQDGVSRMQCYIDFNKKTSVDYAFIQPAINRTNLNVTINSLVTKIRFNKFKKRAEGVEFVRDGQTYFAKANKEVIVSAGAINSPQVLMLSGVGPKKQLEKLDINVVADLPVGQYMIDHSYYASICFNINQTFENNTLLERLNYWKQGKGSLIGVNPFQIVTFLNFDKQENVPEIEVILSFQNSRGIGAAPPDQDVDALHTRDPLTQICSILLLLHPKSIGNVTLKSSDPRDFPEINPNHFAAFSDLEHYYNGIQEVLKLVDSKPFKALNASLNIQKAKSCDEEHEYLTKDWWYCSLMNWAAPAFHAIGTTRMGPDPAMSVVSSDLKVHGFKNLRVVDAGVIPSHISGHLNAPVVMIAEKISDVIKKDWGE